MENFKNFNSKLDRINQVIGVLSKNIESLNKISRFKDYYEQLNANQKNLEELNFLLGKDITSIEKVKNDRRNELLERTMTVIRIMQVFAIDKKKKNLQLRLDHLTSEYVHDSSDLELIKISKKIWLIANKHAGYATTFISKINSALNPGNSKAQSKFEKKYGLIPEMIKYIEETNIRFIEAMLLYRREMNEKENVSNEMKRIYKKTKKLLANKIDRFVLLFESKSPGFYQEYSTIREEQLNYPLSQINDQEIDSHELVTEENQTIQDEPNIKRKKSLKVEL